MTPDVLTPITPDAIVSAIAEAYNGIFHAEIPEPLLAALAAQSCLEVANGAAMHAWNFGNIRGSYNGAWTSFVAGEGHGATAVVLQPGPENRFRAYPSCEDGALDFVRFLCTATSAAANRYQPAIDAAMRGDFAGYVHGLHTAGYFTADETSYAHGLMSREAMLETLPALAAHIAEVRSA